MLTRYTNPFFLAVAILSIVLTLFVLVPLISLLLYTRIDILQQLFQGYTAQEVVNAFIVTFKASILSTALLLIFGVPLGYLLARYSFPGKKLLESIIDIPLVLPHTVAGVAILTGFGSRSYLGSVLNSIGLRIEDSFWGIVAAMMFVSTPIMVDSAKIAFQSIDPELEDVARCLGASPARAFISITLPLALRGIIAGTILSWARALSEVGAILVVAYYPKSINVLVLEYLNVYGLSYAIALSTVLALISIALFTALRFVVGSGI